MNAPNGVVRTWISVRGAHICVFKFAKFPLHRRRDMRIFRSSCTTSLCFPGEDLSLVLAFTFTAAAATSLRRFLCTDASTAPTTEFRHTLRTQPSSCVFGFGEAEVEYVRIGKLRAVEAKTDLAVLESGVEFLLLSLREAG